jgi:hypothetical protein
MLKVPGHEDIFENTGNKTQQIVTLGAKLSCHFRAVAVLISCQQPPQLTIE